MSQHCDTALLESTRGVQFIIVTLFTQLLLLVVFFFALLTYFPDYRLTILYEKYPVDCLGKEKKEALF